jgi:hypothetical protein
MSASLRPSRKPVGPRRSSEMRAVSSRRRLKSLREERWRRPLKPWEGEQKNGPTPVALGGSGWRGGQKRDDTVGPLLLQYVNQSTSPSVPWSYVSGCKPCEFRRRFSPCTIALVRAKALTLDYGVKAMSFTAHAPQAAPVHDADIHTDKKSSAVTRPIRVHKTGNCIQTFPCMDVCMNIEGKTT